MKEKNIFCVIVKSYVYTMNGEKLDGDTYIDGCYFDEDLAHEEAERLQDENEFKQYMYVETTSIITKEKMEVV